MVLVRWLIQLLLLVLATSSIEAAGPLRADGYDATVSTITAASQPCQEDLREGDIPPPAVPPPVKTYGYRVPAAGYVSNREPCRYCVDYLTRAPPVLLQ